MSPQTQPTMFVNNSSLVEYLATTCGLSLITPNLEKKWQNIISTMTNYLKDIDNTIGQNIVEEIDKFMNSWLNMGW